VLDSLVCLLLRVRNNRTRECINRCRCGRHHLSTVYICCRIAAPDRRTEGGTDRSLNVATSCCMLPAVWLSDGSATLRPLFSSLLSLSLSFNISICYSEALSSSRWTLASTRPDRTSRSRRARGKAEIPRERFPRVASSRRPRRHERHLRARMLCEETAPVEFQLSRAVDDTRQPHNRRPADTRRRGSTERLLTAWPWPLTFSLWGQRTPSDCRIHCTCTLFDKFGVSSSSRF